MNLELLRDSLGFYLHWRSGEDFEFKKTSKYWNFKKTGTIYKQNFADKTKFKKVFGAKQNKEMQDQNFDTCFFVFLDLYYKSFVSGR